MNTTLTFEDLAGLLSSARAAGSSVGRRGAQALSFGDFRQAAGTWHAAFAAQPGRRFALYFDDALRFAAALFGAWHAGKTVYLPADVLPATLERLRGEVDGFAGDLPAACTPLQPVEGAAEPAWSRLDAQARQLVIYTSGSTGAASAIEKRLDQLFAELSALEQAFGARIGAAEILATVSHQHIYGLLFGVLWPLAAGRTLQAQRLSYLDDLNTQLERVGAAVLVASPAHLKRLPLALRADDARLHAVFCSGGPLPQEALPDCRARLGQAPIEVYGSSETGGVAWRQRQGTGDQDEIWQPLPGVRWRLEGEQLAVSSAHQDAPDWALTADRVAASAGGFTLLGRADRILKIEEKRISLAAVEQALLATPWLSELRLLALPGAREQLAVVALPSEAGWALHDEEGKATLVARLRAALLGTLEAVGLPRRWRFVAALPLNPQGKSTQAALQALFDPRRPQPRLLAATPTAAELRLVVEAAQPQFDGHFPGHPVLPGVAQLEWAILLGRELFAALPPQFLGMEALKFQQVITPGLAITLALEFKPDTGRLAFTYRSARGQHASGRILFGAAP